MNTMYLSNVLKSVKESEAEGFSLELVDKSTPNFLDKIGKQELTLLIRMLEVLEHSVTDDTKKTYGYIGYDESKKEGIFDKNKIEIYKNNILNKRIMEQNRKFFLLKDKTGKTVSIATTDPIETGVIIHNFTTEDMNRKKGFGTLLMKFISNYAATQNLKNVSISLSHHSQKVGNVEVYRRIFEKIGIQMSISSNYNSKLPVTDKTEEIQISFKPKLFPQLSKEANIELAGGISEYDCKK